MLRMQQQLERELRLGPQIFETVTGNTEFLFPRNIGEFVEMVKAADITARLKDLSVVSLQGMLATSLGSFISYDRQLVTSAIEYPPSLFVITRTCLENVVFNRSRLGGLIKKCDVAKRKDAFIMAYDTLLNQNTKPINNQ